MWSVTQNFLLQWLAWLSELGTSSPSHGPLYATWVGIYTAASPTVGRNTLMSQMVEAAYDGYARQEVVWYPVYAADAGTITLEGGSLFFQPSDSVVSETEAGIFLASALTGGTLWAGLPLPAPGKVMSGPLTVLKVLANISLGFGPNYGGAVVES